MYKLVFLSLLLLLGMNGVVAWKSRKAHAASNPACCHTTCRKQREQKKAATILLPSGLVFFQPSYNQQIIILQTLCFNLYGQVHKGHRALWYDTAMLLQHTNLAVEEEIDTAVERVRLVASLFAHHAHAEDSPVFPDDTNACATGGGGL